MKNKHQKQLLGYKVIVVQYSNGHFGNFNLLYF